ncbi:hypothetical protein KXV79_008526 [Aspergillus fumigatus]|nr:hypothetical protein KXX46_001120 [Aspergillus fumigatus]KAH1853904.1 hypothetical protein KXX43_007570 [Aspergillus fumigatus]KAH2665512.1 hypothetical protein KXV79_008526 [Aspergillus fumigatus]KAH2922401.1 hypothetical protein KXW73_001510 [Aspergillus fumigatus]KAH3079623.1 hypothetical protein KXW78_001279 [Aspergillus fumigatus]
MNDMTNSLLTEHFSYTPLSLIDDIINSINNLIYQAISSLESGLLATPPERLGFAHANSSSTIPDTDEDGNVVYPEAKLELENGLHQLETLLEATVDKAFDKFEIYVLRNIFTVPDDLLNYIRLSHHELMQNLVLDPSPNAPTPETIHALRRKLNETKKLNSSLKRESAQNEAVISRLRSILSIVHAPDVAKDTNGEGKAGTLLLKQEKDLDLSFLTSSPAAQQLRVGVDTGPSTQYTPLTTNTTFILSQLPALQAMLKQLRPRLVTLPKSSDIMESDAKFDERKEYIESRIKLHLERTGQLPVGANGSPMIVGRKIDMAEAQALESVTVGGEIDKNLIYYRSLRHPTGISNINIGSTRISTNSLLCTSLSGAALRSPHVSRIGHINVYSRSLASFCHPRTGVPISRVHSTLTVLASRRLIVDDMATAISKPTSHPPKMKRPPPPFVPGGVNGVKPQQSSSSSSPPSTSKRLPGSNQPTSSPATNGPVTNGINGSANSTSTATNNSNKSLLNRPKKDAQKPEDQALRSQKQPGKMPTTEKDSRLGKICPEPYVKTTSYILRKYSKCPPSLIVHLHPTHFRFEQQDGSFPYNSEMKVIIEHIRAGTVPHDMMEELLRANVRFYEGCLIVKVVDHKSVSAQARKSTAPSTNGNNTPFSIHNYNEHITPSAYVPYPEQNQLTSEATVTKTDAATGSQSDEKGKVEQTGDSDSSNKENESDALQKQTPAKPRVFTTVLHPTPRSLQAELTLLATTPDPRAAKQSATHSSTRPQPTSSSTAPQSPVVASNPPDRGHVAKRQKMLVEPQDLLECESKLTRALAPPLFLDPVNSLEAAQDLLKYLESPLHCAPPPSPKRRKRTVAELAADEALAAEEERFMLIMDERLEPATSGAAGGPKSAVDDTGGGAPFEPRFSRFKTLENIRMQHEEKAKREHEIKVKQEMAKRQQQEQERERRRLLEQRQAEEHAKEEARRQHLAAQQAQAQLAAQQQNRHVMTHANGVSQAPQSSPVVRNQTPLNASSPLVGNTMVTQAGVPMSMTSSAQGAGSPQRPPSALQHGHPNMMSHPMAPSRSQQGQSRHGTPQMTQGTPAMSHATPIMRNVTPTQRLSHGSPSQSTMAPTPVMSQAMMNTPQMGGGMGLTPQQQQMILQRQQLLAQHGQLGPAQFTPQQLAQLQANAHAQQNIQSHQQQMMQAQQQNHQAQQQKLGNQQTYQASLLRNQWTQMQMAQQQQQTQGQQPQTQQSQVHQGSPQMTPQQQQQMMMAAAAQANAGHMPQNFQGVNMAQRYSQLYQQRLLRLRQEMSTRFMAQYGPPTQYPPHIAQQYSIGLERSAKAWVQEIIRREREAAQQQRASQVAAVQAQVMQQQQQQNMMHNAMGK